MNEIIKAFIEVCMVIFMIIGICILQGNYTNYNCPEEYTACKLEKRHLCLETSKIIKDPYNLDICTFLEPFTDVVKCHNLCILEKYTTHYTNSNEREMFYLGLIVVLFVIGLFAGYLYLFCRKTNEEIREPLIV